MTDWMGLHVLKDRVKFARTPSFQWPCQEIVVCLREVPLELPFLNPDSDFFDTQFSTYLADYKI